MRKALSVAARNIVIATTTAAVVATPPLVHAQAVGTNAAVRNSVQIKRAGSTQSQPAVVRERISINDEVGTGAASQLQVLLLDRSIFTVGANARLKIDRFVYDADSNARSVGASVARGAFRFMSGRNLNRPSGPVDVRTPIASIGVRGTIFEGVVGEDAVRIASAEPAVGAAIRGDAETASLIILRGPGPQTRGDTSPGAIDVTAGARTVTLDRPLLAVYAPGPGLPLIGPFQLSTAGLDSMQQLLRTVPTAVPAAPDQAGTSGPSSPVPPPAGPAETSRSRLGLALAALTVAALVVVLARSAGSAAERPVSP